MTPIVLVPGLLSSAEMFAPQAAALRPYGPVTVAAPLEATMGEMAAAILAAAPPRFALAGASMGGYVSLEILRRAPERVVKLALLCTTARPDTPEQVARRRALVAMVRARGLEALTPALGGLLHPAHRRDPTLRDISRRMSRAVGVEGLARQTEAIIGRIDSRPGLSAISVPTLVLVGDRDPLTPPALAEEMAAAIPQARLVVVPQCGHVPTLEQPEAVNRALAEWIAD